MSFTRDEIKLCANEEGVVFGKMTPIQRRLLMAAFREKCADVYTAVGWVHYTGEVLSEYFAYRIDPGTAASPEYAEFVPELNSTGLWVVKGKDPDVHATLGAAVCHQNFKGIQYEGRTDWVGVLDLVTYGRPQKVRFLVRGDTK